MGKVLRETHDRIAMVFQQLASNRAALGHSVYFCEHGLSTDEIDHLKRHIREALAAHPIADFLWVGSYLTLIVCATEVGYRYKGNGTDFWPVLGDAIGYQFDFEDRPRLTNWFKKAAKNYQGAEPCSSDWTTAFCHIAWPITHAVAAHDIRRPFADSLRSFRGSIDESDANVLRQLGAIEPQMGARRYRTWLENETLVAGIVRDLLGGPSLVDAQILSQDFRDRLIEDLRSEPEFSAALRAALVQQIILARSKPSRSPSPTPPPPESIYGTFFLRQLPSNELELYCELPEMPRPIRQALRRMQRTRRWSPRPWGAPTAQAIPQSALSCLRNREEPPCIH